MQRLDSHVGSSMQHTHIQQAPPTISNKSSTYSLRTFSLPLIKAASPIRSSLQGFGSKPKLSVVAVENRKDGLEKYITVDGETKTLVTLDTTKAG